MKNPIVGIIMGSDSDLKVMQEAGKVMEDFGVPYEISVVSAHRTPKMMNEYAQAAAGRGLHIIIAGAGGSAHLPGMTASETTLPVIAVPIKSSKLNGLDSLLSIAQMPPGIPVATSSIDGAKNAGLLAIRILALHDIGLKKKLDKFIKNQAKEVKDKSKHLKASGFKRYLEGMK